MPQHPLRMGRINFLNVLPIYYPLETGLFPHNYEIISAPPAILNDMMAKGELQVSSCSCIEYARHPERYYLVPDLSIGSNGPVMSVLLLSSKHPAQLEGEEILISGQSHTSVALLKLLLRDYYNVKANFRVGMITAALDSPEPPVAFLAIGDEALRLRNHASYPWRVDLADAWRQWTGMPFIFGLWVINAANADSGFFKKDPGELLRRGRDWGLAHMDIILDLTGHGCPLSREELRNYYENGLFFTLDNDEISALRLFYQKLLDGGFIPSSPHLRFYKHHDN